MAESCGTITVESTFSRAAVGIVGCSGLPATAAPGETVTTTVDVVNDNDDPVEVTLVITGDGAELADKTFTVNGGQTDSSTVGFRIPGDHVGDLRIEATLDSVIQGGTGLSLGSLFDRFRSTDSQPPRRDRDRPETF